MLKKVIALKTPVSIMLALIVVVVSGSLSASGWEITSITNNNFSDSYPWINSSGQVVWQGNDGSDDEIYYWNGTSTAKITNNSFTDGAPQINDSGQIVWYGFDGADYE